MALNPGAMESAQDFRILFGMEPGPLAFDVSEFLRSFDTPETSIEMSVSGCLMVLCSTWNIFICTIFSDD